MRTVYREFFCDHCGIFHKIKIRIFESGTVDVTVKDCGDKDAYH